MGLTNKECKLYSRCLYTEALNVFASYGNRTLGTKNCEYCNVNPAWCKDELEAAE